MTDIPDHAVVILAKEYWHMKTSSYGTAYQAVCSCRWKGPAHRESYSNLKQARIYAERDGEEHYDTHRTGETPV